MRFSMSKRALNRAVSGARGPIRPFVGAKYEFFWGTDSPVEVEVGREGRCWTLGVLSGDGEKLVSWFSFYLAGEEWDVERD